MLSAALDIPPVLLLFQVFPWGSLVEVVPGVEAMVEDAVRWVSGRISFPRRVVHADAEEHGPIVRALFEEAPKPPNDGVKLIAAAMTLEKALEARIPLMAELRTAQEEAGDVETAQRLLNIYDEKIEGTLKEIGDARAALWGQTVLESSNSHPSESESDG